MGFGDLADLGTFTGDTDRTIALPGETDARPILFLYDAATLANRRQRSAWRLRVARVTHKRIHVTAWSGSQTGNRFGVALRPVALTDPDEMRVAFREARPTAVIHAAALSSVAACAGDPDGASRINVEATRTICALADEVGARLLHVSTDMVFDGVKGAYREDDETGPLSTYGRTKRDAERIALAGADSAVVRLSLCFGPSLFGRPTFFDTMVTALGGGEPITCFTDEWRTPISLQTAARALVRLVQSDWRGLWHLGGPERLSRLEMGQRLARFLGADAGAIVAASRDCVASPEPRPRDLSLDSSRWRARFELVPWPTFEEALEELGCRRRL